MAQRPAVGINGFGRIGRVLFRLAFEKLDIKAINDTSDVETIAHLLKYDSIHGTFDADIEAGKGFIAVNGKKIPVYSTRNPSEIPWGKCGVDLVLECTGALKKREDAMEHINKGGAKRVMVSAPADDSDLTIVMGVNENLYDAKKHVVVSNASCTTNCLAPLVKVLHEQFGVENGFMTTVHSYTNDQRLMDASHKDMRRARAAAMSMIPTTTGAAKTVGKVIPELKGKIDGVSIRVPTPNVSLIDFVANLKKDTTVEIVNSALIKASEKELKGVLKCEKNELVSIDFKGSPYSSVIDLASTQMIGPRLVKVLSWYDNEAGFSNRMVDLALLMAQKGL
ncbi:MAG: type I glyceraldehyde-3-phosphate dehydrogenase [Oligoflexia bacterium]|nr:type I glyceraldehyde-3-phosphate dehydrogenase [Oligoflexia bacterium]